MIELAKNMVAIDSSPIFGTTKLCEYLHAKIKNNPAHVKLVESTHRGADHCNLIVQSQPDSLEEGLLFVAHLDTADVGVHGLWDKTRGNPFELTIHADKAYGLGVVAKMNFLAMLQAIEKSSKDSHSTPVTLVGTHSQEDGLVGVREFLEDSSCNFKGAVISHPSSLMLVGEGLGISVLDIEIPFSDEELSFIDKYNSEPNTYTQSKVFRGASAHSSNPSLGQSAILKMFDFLDHMPEVLVSSIDGGTLHNTVAEHSIIEFVPVGSLKNSISKKILKVYSELKLIEERFKSFLHSECEPAYSTLNIGKIRTKNDKVVLTISVRLLPSVPEKEYRGWVLQLNKVCKELGCDVSIKKHIPSFRQSNGPDWQDKVRSVYKSLEDRDLSSKVAMSCTEANVLTKSGISSLLFGAGEGPGNIHQANECVSLQELNKASQFYEYLISNS